MNELFNPLNIDTTQYTCTNVFVDLEGVLIESWDNWLALLHNKEMVQYWSELDSFGMPCLFSNAIDDLNDSFTVEKRLDVLEGLFGQLFFNDHECCVASRNVKRLPIWEYKQQGKRQNFIDYVTSLDEGDWNNNLFVLLDDIVEDEFLRFDNFDILFVKV